MNEHQILKEPQISKATLIMIEPQIIKEPQISKKSKVETNPKF